MVISMKKNNHLLDDKELLRSDDSLFENKKEENVPDKPKVIRKILTLHLKYFIMYLLFYLELPLLAHYLLVFFIFLALVQLITIQL